MEFVAENLVATNDDFNPDGKLDTGKVLRTNYKLWLDELTNEKVIELEKAESSNEMVTVYHGTSTAYLHQILENGILSRSECVGHSSNWQGMDYQGEDLESFEEFVYVTNKWQHFYANFSDSKVNSSERHFPCYIECEIPASILIPDEDAFSSKVSLKRFYQYHISKGKVPYTFSGLESLQSYYTAAVLFELPLPYIKKITILGDRSFLEEYVIRPTSSYFKALNDWSTNGGDVDFELTRVLKKEKASKKNKSFQVCQNDLKSVKEEIDDFIKRLK